MAVWKLIPKFAAWKRKDGLGDVCVSVALTSLPMNKKFKNPPIVWLKTTDYMCAWLQHELGSNVRVREQRMVSIQHLKGARDVLRMETTEDSMGRHPIENAMRATRYGCFSEGLAMDADVMKKEYGVTREMMQQYVPIECPKMCLTKNGVIRPWTNDVSLTKEQAAALMRIVRDAFWQAVAEYDAEYALQQDGRRYPAIEMIESFCLDNRIPDIDIQAMRSEWQRRKKRG